jgi:hypothetical protein
MMPIVWAVIAIVVLVSALLIYMEHEWGFALGGSTVVILVISYVSAELVMRSPLVVLLPPGLTSHSDAMAITAGALLVLALIVIAFLAGRSSASRNKS